MRVNKLDPADNDITRGERQQAVVQAVADEVTSFGTFLRMPFIGDDLVAPLATDLSANQLLQLGWVKRRTPSSGILRCRLGGTIADLDGQSFIIGDEDNAASSPWSRARSPPAPAAGLGHVRPGLSCRPRRLSRAGGRPAVSRKGRRPWRPRPSTPSCRLLRLVPAAAAVAVLRGRAPVPAP